MEAIASVLRRFGGVLAAPRRTVAKLAPEQGHRDGLILGSLYVLAVGTYALIESAAGILATRDLNAVLMLASSLGRLLVAPVLVLVAAETILGTGRGHRRGLALVPVLLVAIVAHELEALRIAVPPFAAEIIGGALGLLLVWWVRPVVTPLAVPAEVGR